MDHRYKKFLAVAETGSFSEAAKKLHVTQPAMTLAIASLERAFGTKLYIRKKYAVELTPDGVLVAKAAKKIALAVESMRTQLGLEDGAPNYQVGIIDSLAHLLYGSVEKSQLLNDVEVMVDNSRQIISGLVTKKLDAGLITGQPGNLGSDIAIHKLHGEEFVFVRAPHLVLAEPTTEIDDWLAFNQDSTSFKYFSRQFKRAGLKVTPIFYSTSMELLKEMAVAGKGTALLPRHLVIASVRAHTLAIVRTPPLDRPIWVITRKGGKQTVINRLMPALDRLLRDVSTRPA